MSETKHEQRRCNPLLRPAAAIAAACATLAAFACSEQAESLSALPTGTPHLDAGLPDSCTPSVCAPCDCGAVDDGCGRTLDCGPCPGLPDCADSYGRTEGFELCEQTDEHCSFAVTKLGRSCDEICAEHGGECLAAHGGDGSCDGVETEDDLGCDARDYLGAACVCARVEDCNVPLPTEPEREPPPAGTTLQYRVTYENGTTNANPGWSHVETLANGQHTGSVTVVDNPASDGRNSSAKVGRHRLQPGYARAELSSQRIATSGETHVYKWSVYLPTDFFDDPFNWNMINQWKTVPCGKANHGDQICKSGGIFDDMQAPKDGEGFLFRSRTRPDCLYPRPPLIIGEWVDFVLEVRWTKANSGYIKLWQNGELGFYQRGIKTLFDGFTSDTCDIYWAAGLYGSSDAGLTLYTDDIEIWSK